MENLEGKKVLMIVAPSGFRDEELFEPKAVLEKAGAKVVIASKNVSVAKGMLGAEASVDVMLSDVNINDYSAVILVGGRGATTYFDDIIVLKLVREASSLGKIIGAICIAPTILANAGVLKNKKATAFPSEKEKLEGEGVIYTGEDVTVDGNIVTAKGPSVAKKFGETIAKLI